jgi:ferritin-like metal-binding protein YciE
MKRRERAIKQSDDASRKQAEAEIEMLAERKRAYERFAKTGVDARRQIEKERRKTSAFDTLKQQQSLFNTLSTQAAMDAEADLRKRGARLSKENFDPLTRRRTGATYLLEENGRLSKYRVDYAKEAASMRMVSSQPKRPTDRLTAAVEGLSPRNMLANLVKVSAWSAAVMALYKSADLAAYSFKRLEETGMEMAHLDVVFRGVGGSAKDLTMDIIQLAAAQGRSTSEAMESATEWARLGGSRAEINEEVRVSAMAANIAQTHLSETTKQLSALMHIYHLEAGDLNGTLNWTRYFRDWTGARRRPRWRACRWRNCKACWG